MKGKKYLKCAIHNGGQQTQKGKKKNHFKGVKKLFGGRERLYTLLKKEGFRLLGGRDVL